MEPRTIVAVEIASSKIKGGVAAVGPDGRLTILAVEEIPGINNVRYGRIQNIREVSAAVNEIIRRFEANPAISPRTVDAVVLSIGGRSLTGVPARASLRFPHECEITDDHVQRLKYEATRDYVGDKNVEASVARMYYVNNSAVRRVVGTFGNTLSGEFMMITCGKETRQNLERLKIDNIDSDSVFFLIRPMAVADLVLTSDEKELGTVLVDFGAETTTVAIYKDSSLAFLSTLPMGSRLITLDLMAGLGITEEAAENFKLTLGNADASAPSRADNPNAEEVNAYVRARAAEIAANIINQIDISGYNAESLSNIVLVGGGSRLSEFGSQLSSLAKMNVRLGSIPAGIAFRVAGRNNPDNIDIVALLATASRHPNIDCLSPVAMPPVYENNAGGLDTDDTDPDTDTAAAAISDSNRTAGRVTAQNETPAADISSRQEQHRTPTIQPDDDEDDILRDDEDDDEDNNSANTRRGGFSSWFRRKKKTREAEPDFDENDEPYDDEQEASRVLDNEIHAEPRVAPEKPHPDSTRINTAIEGIKNRIISVFMPPEGDDGDDE